MWNNFIENSKTCYLSGQNITVDKQLFQSKARCKFMQCVPNNPDTFGIKCWLYIDIDTKYFLFSYRQDKTANPELRLSENVVMKLTEPYLKKGRNILQITLLLASNNPKC